MAEYETECPGKDDPLTAGEPCACLRTQINCTREATTVRPSCDTAAERCHKAKGGIICHAKGFAPPECECYYAHVECYANTCWAAREIMDSCRGEDVAVQCRIKGWPHLLLNISHNRKIAPENLRGLSRPAYDRAMRAHNSFQEFSAWSCTRLAGPYMEGPNSTENILKNIAGCGASRCGALTESQGPASM